MLAPAGGRECNLGQSARHAMSAASNSAAVLCLHARHEALAGGEMGASIVGELPHEDYSTVRPVARLRHPRATIRESHLRMLQPPSLCDAPVLVGAGSGVFPAAPVRKTSGHRAW